jgi:hypothetical protein
MVEVFTTSVQEQCEADKILVLLQQRFPASKINFDLHDCDKILRVEGNTVEVEKVMMLVKENGFVCRVLE